MQPRVGFIVGKGTDPVSEGSLKSLRGIPESLCVGKCIHVDVAIAWKVRQQGFDVDIIPPAQLTLERLRANACNFIIGWDLIDAALEGTERLEEVARIFLACGNLVPSWEVQQFIYHKERYLSACLRAGVPVAPTFFVYKGQVTAEGVLARVKERGWKEFVVKRSFSCWSIGFARFSVEACEERLAGLQAYLAKHPDSPAFVVQEFLGSFASQWEMRLFWWEGELVYAVANKAAVATGKAEVVVTGADIPADFLEAAIKVGSEALKALPPCSSPGGVKLGMPLIRTDIGCSVGPVSDRRTKWDARRKTFFLNEIEYGGTNYFARHLPFDCVPLWAAKYAAKAKEILEVDAGAPVRCTFSPSDDPLVQAVEWLSSAGALIVACGSGMGMDRDAKDEIRNPAWLDVDERSAWGVWLSSYSQYHNSDPHEGYKAVLEWAKAAPLGGGVMTTNVDNHWLRAGWSPDSIMELNGSARWLQCRRADCRAAWPTPPDFSSLGDPGKCPCCGGTARPGVRMLAVGDVQDSGFCEAFFKEQRDQFEAWCSFWGHIAAVSHSLCPVFLELGCGESSLLRKELERMALEVPSGKFIRINTEHHPVHELLSDRGVSIQLGAADALSRMRRLDRAIPRASFICQDEQGNGAEFVARADTCAQRIFTTACCLLGLGFAPDVYGRPPCYKVQNVAFDLAEEAALGEADAVPGRFFFARACVAGEEMPLAFFRVVHGHFLERNAALDARAARVDAILTDLNEAFGSPEHQQRVTAARDRVTLMAMIKDVQVEVLRRHDFPVEGADSNRLQELVRQMKSFNTAGMQGRPDLEKKVQQSLQLSGFQKLESLPRKAKQPPITPLALTRKSKDHLMTNADICGLPLYTQCPWFGRRPCATHDRQLQLRALPPERKTVK